MGWLGEHWLHLGFILLYLTVLVYHAWVSRRHAGSLENYLVAGRSLGGWVVALSFYATFMSTNTFIGAAGKSWDVGLVWCMGGVVLVGLCCVSWFIVAPRFVPLTRKYQSLTVPDFLGHHYNSMALRRAAAVIVCFASIVYLVAIYRGSALALGELLELRYDVSALLIFVVVTAYTLVGGFRSVVLTDALQGTLMVAGAVAMFAAVLWRGGGPGTILEDLHRQDPSWVSFTGNGLAIALALNLSVGLKYLVEPRQLSRFYGLKDSLALRRAAVIAPLLVLVSYVCLLPIGAFAHALIPAGEIESSDQVVPHLLASANLFGPALGGLFLLVLLSAAMSSIDSVLLVAASSLDHDLIAPDRNDNREVTRTRMWVIVVSLISMLIAVSPLTKDIMTITAFSGSLYGACFLPALIVGLFWRGPKAPAAIASLVCGAIAVVGWFVAKKLEWTSWHEVYIGLAVGLSVYVAMGMVHSFQQGRRPE